ncbi:MAG TPA: hypothetical protein VE011_02205 [Candidatus Dormibacteraeota bacterium]|nr:hypothetical protein [Candidatus Dormibacteraeota bacterium]
MLASQVNLDHRLAELRQIGTELRDAQAARDAGRPTRSIATTLSSLLGWAPAPRRLSAAAR